MSCSSNYLNVTAFGAKLWKKKKYHYEEIILYGLIRSCNGKKKLLQEHYYVEWCVKIRSKAHSNRMLKIGWHLGIDFNVGRRIQGGPHFDFIKRL